ncbi:MAG: hypothetical protein HZB91_07180 [Elusimicrobia bacterium]|nr:hypothetical protein [Elusimicrobiota bacterium]
MELYFNETLIGLCPEEDDLWAAFEELREEVLGYLLLRRGPGSAMSVLKAPGIGFCVTAEQGEGLFGIIFPEEQADAAIEALVEFLRGSLPRIFDPGFQEDDCPLCSAMAGQAVSAGSAACR